VKLFGAAGEEVRGRSAWSWILSASLAALLLWWALRGVEWKQVAAILVSADWRLVVVAAGATSFSLFLRGLRWRILLNATCRLPVATVFWANNAGYLGNNLLPARAGELIRSFLISSRSPLSRTYVLTTALSERLMDVIALVLWSSLLLMGVHPNPGWMEGLSRTMAIVAGAGAAAIAIVPHTGRLLETILEWIPMPSRVRQLALGLAEQVLSGMRALHDWSRFTGFAGLTVVIWLSDTVGAMAIGRALGLALPFSTAFLLLTGMGLSSALPSTPGYVGIYQFVAVTVLTLFGYSRDGAIAMSLMLQAIGYAVVVTFGLIAVFRLRQNRGSDNQRRPAAQTK
jgi:glycosyltransferase 2 family protein